MVLNALTSPGMVAASLAALRRGGRFIEIGKRDIWAAATVKAQRPDAHHSLLAIDFFSEGVLHTALVQLSAGVAAGTVQSLQTTGHALASVQAALRQISRVRRCNTLPDTLLLAHPPPVVRIIAHSLCFEMLLQAQHVSKVVVNAPTESPLLAQSCSTVLVTGGLGSLGTLVAHWIICSATRHLHLLGRTGRHSTPKMAASWQIGTCAAAVTLSTCDVCRRDDLKMVALNGAGNQHPIKVLPEHCLAGGRLASSHAHALCAGSSG